MIAKLDDKNRIVIPKKMLQELDYKKDDELYLKVENNRLILERSKRIKRQIEIEFELLDLEEVESPSEYQKGYMEALNWVLNKEAK